MERWVGKTAVVVGASSGLGAGIVIDLLKAGVVVVGMARRPERVKALLAKVPEDRATLLHTYKVDVTVEEEILAAFQWVKRTLGGVDILVYSAGVYNEFNLVDKDSGKLIKQALEINVLGMALCAREAFQSMKERSFDGHVVLINSVAGHYVPHFPASIGPMNIETPTKYAVTAMTEILRQEFINEKTKIKITSVSPGTVNTEILTEELRSMVMLNPEDIAAGVMYALGTPPHVQVHELTIRPVGETF